MSETGSSRRPTAQPGSSLGSATNRVHPPLPASGGSSIDDEPTVITTRADFSNVSLMQPLQLGKVLEGERLGQFILQEFVGGGGMGAVFRALDTTLNREVAVKVLPKGQAGDEETLRRFRNEAQSAARLNHDNIARVHYVGEDRGVHYIVFEFIEGVNIRDLVDRRGPLPLVEAVSYTLQVAEALAHAAERDVIHRDIKPSNVLVTPEGKAKLVDMGLARLHQVERADDLTASGVTLGTFDYISPEQARDPRSADVRSDLYSLGCSFYFMLTGRPPFPVGTVLQKLLQHQGDEPPDVRGFRPDLPDEICRVLAKLLAKNPTDRYQLPSDLIAELTPLAEQLGMVHSSRSAPTWIAAPRPVSPWVRQLPWMVPIGILILSVVGLDFYWSIDSPRVEPSFRPSRTATSSAAGANGGETKATTGTDAPPEKLPAPNEALNPAGLVQGEVERSGITLGSALSGASLNLGTLSAGISVDPTTPPGAALPAHPGKDASGSGKPDSASGRRAESAAGLLVVSDVEQDGTYSSLQAACSAAKSGETIELRYSGRREERPISLANIRLTIRAADGFRPVVVFRPTEPSPVLCPRSMITIAGGEFKSSGVAWELDVPREVPADNWAPIETRRADLLRFDDCSLTIRNAALGQSSVAFVDVKAAPGGDSGILDAAGGEPTDVAESSLVIALKNCIARGEATFVRSSEMQGFGLVWENGLLATNERLLFIAGGATAPRHSRRINVTLQHLTTVLQGGLAQMSNNQDARYQLPVEIRCVDSIVSAGTSASPLIEQKGIEGVDGFHSLFHWTGDHNFYDGFEIFWRILKVAPPLVDHQLSFSQWKYYWKGHENQATSEMVAWHEPVGNNRPFHAQLASDYTLSQRSGRGAIGGASDGRDAGFIADELPPLPPDERLSKQASR